MNRESLALSINGLRHFINGSYSYLAYLKRLSDKFGWKEKELMLAFDYTDEDFYGDVQGFNIHGWTGEGGVTGKFKFLTCSIVSDEIPEKIPLISIHTHIGDYKMQQTSKK